MRKNSNNFPNLSELYPSESITLWNPPEEDPDYESAYYDRKADLQGEVPGSSLEEAKEAYEKKYGIKL